MTGSEPPEEPKFPQLFESGRKEQAGARDLLLWIEECYLQAVNYDDPCAGPDQIEDMIATEYEDTDDQVSFAELGPKPGVVANRYLAKSAGQFGNWKVVMRRNDKGRMKTPWSYEFETIEGDIEGFCRYITERRVTYALRNMAPLRI